MTQDLTPFASLSDEELLRHTYASKPTLSALEIELATRLEQALDAGTERPVAVGDFMTRTLIAQESACHCRSCRPVQLGMVLCPKCGNKHCPKASNHKYACTNSNAPDQPGSVYSTVATSGYAQVVGYEVLTQSADSPPPPSWAAGESN